MTQSYGDIRHAQPACRFGNCTFVDFGLSGKAIEGKTHPSYLRLYDSNGKTACQRGFHLY
eukprot:4690449-Amphidinium_carterae.1